MKSVRILGVSGLVAAAVMLSSATVPEAAARDNGLCSVETLKGRWMFAAGMGELFHEGFRGQTITALGTMDFDGQGNLTGAFDNTIARFGAFVDTTYWGRVTVDADCTGTLQFTTSSGSRRTDSIAIVRHDEVWGMSLDPLNPWTYVVKRIRTGYRERDERD